MKGISTVGLHSERIGRTENYAEKVYAAEWAHENRAPRPLLRYLLSYGPNSPERVSVSLRDAEVAATVIQWLGSGIGQEFVARCQEKIGKQRGKR